MPNYICESTDIKAFTLKRFTELEPYIYNNFVT